MCPTCAQSMALGTHTKFQLEILIRSMILVIYKFRENILESSSNVSETSPWHFDCPWWPSANEATLRDMGKTYHYENRTTHSKAWTVHIIFRVYFLLQINHQMYIAVNMMCLLPEKWYNEIIIHQYYNFLFTWNIGKVCTPKWVSLFPVKLSSPPPIKFYSSAMKYSDGIWKPSPECSIYSLFSIGTPSTRQSELSITR